MGNYLDDDQTPDASLFEAPIQQTSLLDDINNFEVDSEQLGVRIGFRAIT